MREKIVQRRRVNFDTRQDAADGRRPQIQQPLRAAAEEHVRILEDRRIDRRRAAFLNAELGLDDRRSAVGLVHAAAAAEVQDGTPGVVDRRALLSNVKPSRLDLQFLALVCRKVRGEAERGNGLAVEHLEELGAAADAVIVRQAAHVAQPCGVRRDFRDRKAGARRVHAPALHGLHPFIQACDVQPARRNLRRPVGHLAGLRPEKERADGRPDALKCAAKRLVIRDSIDRRLGEYPVERDRPGAAALTEAEEGPVDFARPGPRPAVLGLAPVEAVLVEQDDLDLFGRRRHAREHADAPAPEHVFRLIQPAGMPATGRDGRGGKADEETVKELL